MSEYKPFYIRPDQIQNLKQYPFLESYVKSYIENKGIPENIDCICRLTYFFKRMYIEHELDMQSLFDWDDDTTEDFYSWGHNSRWANIFEGQMEGCLEDYVDVALGLAEFYGDIDLDNLGDDSY